MTTTIKDFLLRKNAEYGRKAQAAAAAYEYEASARYYQKAAPAMSFCTSCGTWARRMRT